MREELIRQYQDGITALYVRQRQLEKMLQGQQGKRALELTKRIELLQTERQEMCYALRQLIRGVRFS